jgi:demethylspheroidene O-methyltransferase
MADVLPVMSPQADGAERPDWRRWRDRLLASPRFHRWAAALPGLRWMTRRQSRRLFDLVAGFTYSQILLSCVRLGLFEHLRDGARSVTDLQALTGLGERSLDILLRAGVSLDLLEWRGAQGAAADRRVGLGMLGAVVAGSPAIRALIEHHQAVYDDLKDPVDLLRHPERSTQLRRYWAYAEDGYGPAGADGSRTGRARGLDAERVADYSELMAASQPLVAQQVLASFDFSRYRCLLDLGGGQGAFLAQVARQHPSLSLMLFDLPAVADRARTRFAADGMGDRVACHGGSFFDDAMPQGADLVSLVRVLYDHPDERALSILKAARQALGARGGDLILAEPMSGTPGAEAMGDAYFGFYLLAMGKGRARTAEELCALVLAAGFDQAQPVKTRVPLQTGLIHARVAANRENS